MHVCSSCVLIGCGGRCVTTCGRRKLCVASQGLQQWKSRNNDRVRLYDRSDRFTENMNQHSLQRFPTLTHNPLNTTSRNNMQLKHNIEKQYSAQCYYTQSQRARVSAENSSMQVIGLLCVASTSLFEVYCSVSESLKYREEIRCTLPKIHHNAKNNIF